MDLVFKQPLALHSTSPVTGFLRNGYCEVPASDYGNHAVAAEVSEEFLEFSVSILNIRTSAINVLVSGFQYRHQKQPIAVRYNI
jgi:uncharacterized protein (DUF2237 family)